MRPTLAALLLATTTILGSACISGYETTDGGSDDGGDDVQTDDGLRTTDCKKVEVDGDILAFDSDAAISESHEIPKKGCWDLYGTLELTGRDITTLAGLKGLKSVDNITVDSTALTTFDTQFNVISVGDTKILDNTHLTSIEKLEVRRFNAQTNGISLDVERNDVLPNLGSLSLTKELDADLTIVGNDVMTKVDLSHLSKFGEGKIAISQNIALVEVDLSALSGTLHDFVLQADPKLTKLTLGLVEKVGALSIISTGLTNLSAFGTMTGLQGNLQVTANTHLTAIAPFNQLYSIAGAVSFRDNTSLNECQVKELATCVTSFGNVLNINNQASASCAKFWCQP